MILCCALLRSPIGSLYEAQKSGEPFTPSPKGKALIEEKIMPDLQNLMSDEDVDVRYFASMARGVQGVPDEMVTSP
jgi:serine/threonine-protein phosphatase 2A regulatory subunit A